jgi:hypothetical protein
MEEVSKEGEEEIEVGEEDKKRIDEFRKFVQEGSTIREAQLKTGLIGRKYVKLESFLWEGMEQVREQKKKERKEALKAKKRKKEIKPPTPKKVGILRLEGKATLDYRDDDHEIKITATLAEIKRVIDSLLE